MSGRRADLDENKIVPEDYILTVQIMPVDSKATCQYTNMADPQWYIFVNSSNYYEPNSIPIPPFRTITDQIDYQCATTAGNPDGCAWGKIISK